MDITFKMIRATHLPNELLQLGICHQMCKCQGPKSKYAPVQRFLSRMISFNVTQQLKHLTTFIKEFGPKILSAKVGHIGVVNILVTNIGDKYLSDKY